mmetsp:Transcript_24553/g.59204  ORF Transcript_24553/g.59204 Transcript_24553/m.59204 type:complete len:208 (-) Transcript_24553:997-1620(-)
MRRCRSQYSVAESRRHEELLQKSVHVACRTLIHDTHMRRANALCWIDAPFLNDVAGMHILQDGQQQPDVARTLTCRSEQLHRSMAHRIRRLRVIPRNQAQRDEITQTVAQQQLACRRRASLRGEHLEKPEDVTLVGFLARIPQSPIEERATQPHVIDFHSSSTRIRKTPNGNGGQCRSHRLCVGQQCGRSGHSSVSVVRTRGADIDW